MEMVAVRVTLAPVLIMGAEEVRTTPVVDVTLKHCVIGVAASQLELPGCVAVTHTEPGPVMVSTPVVLFTVAIVLTTV